VDKEGDGPFGDGPFEDRKHPAPSNRKVFRNTLFADGKKRGWPLSAEEDVSVLKDILAAITFVATGLLILVS